MTASANKRNFPCGVVTARAWRLAAVAALAVTLTACKGHDRQDVAGWMTSDPIQNHPIIVDRKEIVLDLSVPAGSYGLSHNQKGDLRGFAMRFKQDDSGGILVVSMPSGGSNEIAAMRAMDEVRRVIRDAGVLRDESRYEVYPAAGQAAAPIRVSFLRHVAQAPVCGDWSQNIGRDPKNVPFRNLGCATQHNLAAMVSNPRDLVEPRGITPRSSERRDTTWQKYTKGETTIAKKDNEEKAKVSEVEGGDN